MPTKSPILKRKAKKKGQKRITGGVLSTTIRKKTTANNNSKFTKTKRIYKKKSILKSQQSKSI